MDYLKGRGSHSSAPEVVDHLSELQTCLHGRGPVVVLVGDPTVSVLQHGTGKVRCVTAAERCRHSRAAAEIMWPQANAQRHLGRLRDREFNRTDGQRLS